MEDYYIPDQGVRGICFLVVNQTFQHLNPRTGSELDAKYMRELWSQRGFKVVEKNELTEEQLRSEIKKCAEDKRHKSASCFVCAISSHGYNRENERLIMGIDSTDKAKREDTNSTQTNGVNLDTEIIEVFGRLHNLKGKPKIFLIQACQGGGIMDVLRNNDIESDDPSSEGQPIWADAIIFESTVPGYKAYRSISQGSVFLKTFTDVMMKHGDSNHISDLATILNRELAKIEIEEQTGVRTQQQCQVRSTLHKRLHLPSPKKPKERIVIYDGVPDDEGPVVHSDWPRPHYTQETETGNSSWHSDSQEHDKRDLQTVQPQRNSETQPLLQRSEQKPERMEESEISCRCCGFSYVKKIHK